MPKLTIKNSDLHYLLTYVNTNSPLPEIQEMKLRLRAQIKSIKEKFENNPARAFDNLPPEILGNYKIFDGKCYQRAMINSKLEVLKIFPLFKLSDFDDTVVEDITAMYGNGSIYTTQETGQLLKVDINEENLYGKCANCGEFTPVANYRPMMEKFQCVCC